MMRFMAIVKASKAADWCPSGPSEKTILVLLSIVAPPERLLGVSTGAKTDLPVETAGMVVLQTKRRCNDAIHDAGESHQGLRSGRFAG